MKKTLSLLILFITVSISTPANSVEIPWVPSIKDIMQEMGDFTEKELNPNSIKILVWNMYKGSNETWEQDFEKLSMDQDILITQEMYLNEMMIDIFENHQGYGYHTATSFMYLPSRTRTGVASASKVRPTSFKYQRSRVLEPVIETPKMALETFYKLKGTDQELMVVNIHAINFVSSLALATQLKDLAKDIKKFKGPVIFAGDFNTWSKDKLYFMNKIIIEGLGMREVKFKEDNRKKVFGNIIDYVFIKGLEVVESKSYGDIEGSDHTPMTVELRFPTTNLAIVD